MFRRGMRSFRSRSRQATQWISAMNGNGTVALAAATLVTAVEIDTSSAVATTPFVSRLTIQRIRAHLTITSNDNVNNARIRAGFAVTPIAQGATIKYDPSLATDGEHPWLWLGQFFLQPSGSQWNFVVEKIDVRVKRIMRPDEILGFFIISSAAAFMTLNTRTLISRVA